MGRILTKTTVKRRKNFRREFAQLRQQTHRSMKYAEEARMKSNPTPTEEELYMGAFNEWLEPQVREAIMQMYRKGYATQSSGFHGEQHELQSLDGYFTIDDVTKRTLRRMRVEVLRGPDIGLSKNKLITIIRFRAKKPSLDLIKDRWDAIAAALPEKSFPTGIRPISNGAEQFRREFAPEHPALDKARERYFEYLERRPRQRNYLS